MSAWNLKLWQKRRLIWQQRRVAVISALGGERDRLSLTCINASAAHVAYLAIDGSDLQRRCAIAQCPSLSGHGDLAQKSSGFSDNPN